MRIYTEDERAVVGHLSPEVGDGFEFEYLPDPAEGFYSGHMWINETIDPASMRRKEPKIVPFDKFDEYYTVKSNGYMHFKERVAELIPGEK